LIQPKVYQGILVVGEIAKSSNL